MKTTHCVRASLNSDTSNFRRRPDGAAPRPRSAARSRSVTLAAVALVTLLAFGGSAWAGVSITCPSPINLPCNPTRPVCNDAQAQATVTMSCATSPTVTCVDNGLVISGCNYSNSFTITATDNTPGCTPPTASCDVIYTWTEDTTKPVLTPCPAPIVTTTTNAAGRAVTYTPPTATDGCGPANPVVTCTPVSGSTFPIGTTVVSCCATDNCGNFDCCTFPVTVQKADPCTQLDNNNGTVNLPPAGCPYLSPDQVHMLINGLPAGTTILAQPLHHDFLCGNRPGVPGQNPAVCSFVIPGCTNTGGDLGGEQECADSTLDLHLRGTGLLNGYDSMKTMPVSFQTAIGPRTPGDPVQSFDTEMFRLQGQLPPGDPDFDLLRITAGNDFGLPSPGHTTLKTTDTPGPGATWTVDSFFDITYRIDFVGHSGGPFGGMSGSTTGTIRMLTGNGVQLICPKNVDVTSSGSTVVTYPDPVVSSPCTPVTVQCVPPSGSTFAYGTTVVTCTAQDACGQSAVCEFTVTVLRDYPTPIDSPTPNCPPPGRFVSPDITALTSYQVSPSQVYVIKNVCHGGWTPGPNPPPTTGYQTNQFNSGGRILVSSDGGNHFDVFTVSGPTTVTLTPTTKNGNTQDYDTEMLQLDLSGGGIMIRESPTLQSLGRVRESPTLQPTGHYQIASFFDVFTELSVDGGQSWHAASGPIPVNLVPLNCAAIQCPTDKTYACGPNNDTSPTAAGAGYPTTAGACSSVTVSNYDVPGGTTCSNYIIRTWTATDPWGAISNCVQVITIVDTNPPSLVVQCPPTTLCFPSTTAAAAYLVSHSTAHDTCCPDPIQVTAAPAQGLGTACDPVMRVTATDCCGNSTNKDCTVHVDGTPPTLTSSPGQANGCPNDIVVNHSPSSGSVVIYTPPTGSDNCGPNPTPVTCNPPPNSNFLPGITTVSCCATDACGNFSCCTFKVTVNKDTGDPCLVVDNGTGTVNLPPAGCPYLSPDQVHMIINGLPPGTTIHLSAIHSNFICKGTANCPGDPCASGPCDPNLGGTENFNSTLLLHLEGTGALQGFSRNLTVQTACKTHVGPRHPGDPVQSFDTEMLSILGQLPPGDPDFDLLRITAGNNNGLPSPGHTTLTVKQGTPGPGAQWAVDSFFDITYRIDFIGHPGGHLGGMSGSTTGTIRMIAGNGLQIKCPKDIVDGTTLSSKVINYPTPIAAGNCPPITVTCNPPSGSSFTAGTTTPVSCTAQDACGQTANCQFNVTVKAVTDPAPLIAATTDGGTLTLDPGDYGCIHLLNRIIHIVGGPGVKIYGCSPALDVDGSVVSVSGMAYSVTGNDPTVLVRNGGALTMRTSSVDESTGAGQVCLLATDTSTVDLGVEGDPGGNTFNINGSGSLISNATANAISAVGNTWQQDGSALPDNFAIEDNIRHTLDDATLGLVSWVSSNVYPTTVSGSIQRGIDAVATNGTVNIQGGVYTESVNGGAPPAPPKAITLKPGASPAQVTINGDLALSSGDTLVMDINGTTPGTDYDQLKVLGTVNLGSATLSLIDGPNVQGCGTYTIIDNDMADPVTGTFFGQPEGSTLNGGSHTYRITYVGGTGNDVVLLADTTPPTVSTCPTAPIELGCNPNPTPTCANAITNVSFMDNCPCTLVTNCTDNGLVTDNCRRTNSFTVTATDCQGNTSAPCVVTYSWTVATAPVFLPGSGCGSTTPLGCNPASIPTCATATAPSATNECGAVTVTCDDGTDSVTGCNHSRTLTFSATACGFTTTCTRTYTWSVVTAPVFAAGSGCGSTTSSNCNPTSIPTCGTAILPTASDECGAVTVTCSQAADVVTGCNNSRTLTFTATNACSGLSSTCTRTYTWTVDNTGPVFTNCPSVPINLGCNVPTPNCTTVATLGITVGDGCSGTLTATCKTNLPIVTNICQRTLSFTLTAVDSCNNTSTCQVVYNWTIDTNRPTYTAFPAGGYIGCNLIAPTNDNDVRALVQVSDNCSVASTNISHMDTVSGCTNIRTFTVIASDQCNNSTNKTAVYTWVTDTTPPYFTKCPNNLFLSCNPTTIPDCTEAQNPNIVAATDNCGTPVISCQVSNYATPDSCFHDRTLTFTATDFCGNVSTNCVQHIFWTQDTTPPTFGTFPSDVNAGCNPLYSSLPNCNLNSANVQAQDICSFPTITCNQPADVTNGCARTRTITYTATDQCGNSVQQSQTVRWTNQVAPVFVPAPFSTVPQPYSQACGATNDLGCNPTVDFLAQFDCNPSIHATNTCDVPAVTCTKQQTTNCALNMVIVTRILTYKAVSACATSVCSQTYFWRQTSPPHLVTPPNPGTVNLGCNPSQATINSYVCNPGSVVFTNDCDPNPPVVTCTSNQIVNGCVYTNMFTYTVTNVCGQSASTKQVVYWLQDNTPPTMNNCPTPTFVDLGCNPASVPECDGTVTATSSCGSTPARSDLLVASRNNNQVMRYNGVTGAFVNLAAQSGAAGGGLNSPAGLAIDTALNLWVSSSGNNSIKRYDWTTGTFLNTIVTIGSGGLSTPAGLLLRNSVTNMYVSSAGSSSVKTYAAIGGAYQADFVGATSGGLGTPAGLVFGPSGDLYVADAFNNSVKRYNGTTGAYISNFVASGSGGLSQPAGLAFGPDGHLYVASSGDNSVKRYEGTTGASLGNFVNSGDNGLGAPSGLVFGPDNNLYVASAADSTVKRYNSSTGAFIDNFVTAGSGGLNGPSYLTFTPALQFIEQVAVVCTQTNVVDSQVACIHYRTNAYTAIDVCGQSNYCQQVFTWKSNYLALVGCPAATTNLGCNPVHLPVCGDYSVTAVGNCSPAAVTCARSPTATIGCLRQRTFVWTATDLCGVSITCTQVATWTVDTTAPQFTKTPTNLVDLGCNPTATMLASNACDLTTNNVIVTDNCTLTNFSCLTSTGVVGCVTWRTNTYTAMDECGNTAIFTQLVTWRTDIVAPVITCPPATNAFCGQADPTFTGVPTATDNCGAGNVTFTYTDTSLAVGCPTNHILTRHWTGTDLCGNSMSCDQTITVLENGNTGPIFTNCPSDLHLGCNPPAIPDCDTNIGAHADCGLTLTCSRSDQTNGCLYTRTITYTAQDSCHNFSLCTYRIDWTVDTNPPVFTKCPASIDLGCNPAPNTIPDCDTNSSNVAAVNNDTCGANPPTITCSKLDIINSCGTTRKLTYTATDECGNKTFCVQFISWKTDTTPPVLSGFPAMALVHLGCNPSSIPTTNSYNVTAVDGCSNPTLTKSQTDTVSQNGCNYIRVLSWTATDFCGNSTNRSQTIDWTVDITPPVVTVPTTGLDLGCVGNPPDDNTVAVSITDGCGGTVMTNISHVDATSGCTNTRTFTVIGTDGCGNKATNTATYTWKIDTTPPGITCPPDFVTTCGQIAPSTTGTPTSQEGCSGATFSYTDSSVAGVCPTNTVITRHWTATDGCNNSSDCFQTIWVTDPNGPAFTNCPANINLGCNPQTIPGCSLTVGVSLECNATVTCVSSADIVSNCQRYRTNTYTAVDGCGQSSTCVQVVTWTVDVTPPTLTNCPAPTKDLGCNPSNSSIPKTNTYAVGGTDGCGGAVTVYKSQVDQVTGCNHQRTITYYGVDSCNNTSAPCSQVVTWTVDSTSPVFTKCPASIDLGCNPLTIPDCNLDVTNVAASDNCGVTNIDCHHVDQANGCFHTRTIVYTAHDVCDNTRSCIQAISWRVDLPPVITNCPANVDLGTNPQTITGCDQNVGASDDCGANATVQCVSSTPVTNGCNVAQTNTYTATGGCNLSSTCTQVVTWKIADAPPTLTVTLSGNNVVICWPVTCATWYLEQATSLTSPITWTRVLTAPVVSGGQNCVTLPYSGIAFFRLCAGPSCP